MHVRLRMTPAEDSSGPEPSLLTAMSMPVQAALIGGKWHRIHVLDRAETESARLFRHMPKERLLCQRQRVRCNN